MALRPGQLRSLKGSRGNSDATSITIDRPLHAWLRGADRPAPGGAFETGVRTRFWSGVSRKLRNNTRSDTPGLSPIIFGA